MSGTDIFAATRSVLPFIERHLMAGFAELDAQTGSVETRKALYAAFVERAIALASGRLPENKALIALLSEFQAGRGSDEGPATKR